uniref:Uncharacterized protein n=1 Tax=Solanum tuberosum TaxID=4113 RepID=M1DWA5_SOLTU
MCLVTLVEVRQVAMKAKGQDKDITRQKIVKELKKLKKSKVGTRQSHSVTRQVDLQLAQSSSRPDHGQNQLGDQINISAICRSVRGSQFSSPNVTGRGSAKPCQERKKRSPRRITDYVGELDLLRQKESSLSPPKWQNGIVINESSQQETTLRSSMRDKEQPRKWVVRKSSDIRSKLVQPSQDQALTSRVLSIITPRALNRLKDVGERSILEKGKLFTNRVISEYPAISDMIKFHGLERFTKPRPTYVPTWMMVHATLERSLEETSVVATSGVSSHSTILHVDVSGIDAPFEPTFLLIVITLRGTNAQDNATPSKTLDARTQLA